MKTKYPFAMLATIISANILAHERGLLTSKQFYTELEDLSEILRKWNDEQFVE